LASDLSGFIHAILAEVNQVYKASTQYVKLFRSDVKWEGRVK